jgi:hypothetical protein
VQTFDSGGKRKFFWGGNKQRNNQARVKARKFLARKRVRAPAEMDKSTSEWMILADRSIQEAQLPIPHSPMVCVKLPKTVLVLFHLLEQRSCQFFRD